MAIMRSGCSGSGGNKCRPSPQSGSYNHRVFFAPRDTVENGDQPRIFFLEQGIESYGLGSARRRLGRVLHMLGFSWQKPRRRSREQDPKAVRAWRHATWPATRKGRSRSSELRTSRRIGLYARGRWCGARGCREARRPCSCRGTAGIARASSRRWRSRRSVAACGGSFSRRITTPRRKTSSGSLTTSDERWAAQLTRLPPLSAQDDSALGVRFGCASALARGWLPGGPQPN